MKKQTLASTVQPTVQTQDYMLPCTPNKDQYHFVQQMLANTTAAAAIYEAAGKTGRSVKQLRHNFEEPLMKLHIWNWAQVLEAPKHEARVSNTLRPASALIAPAGGAGPQVTSAARKALNFHTMVMNGSFTASGNA